MVEPILVFAGTEQQAREWRHEHGLLPREAVSVHDPRAVQGRRGASYAIVGTFGDTRRQRELWDYAIPILGEPWEVPNGTS